MAENEKKTNKERLKDITDSIEKGIQDLFQSDKYAEYLRTMSRFHKYSVNNTMLIYMQKPNATLVAGFNKWRDQFERNVMKGEKGIKIIAPTPYKKKIEQEKRDPDTNLPMLDADGKVIIEEKEIKIPMYKPVTVFDVSQTEGKPLPQLASDLSGNVQNYEVFMEALRRSSPVPIEIIPIRDGSDGYFSLDTQKIAIREGMSEVQTVSAVVHEIAHSKLHNQKRIEEPKNAEKYQEVEIFDVPALFSNGRVAPADLPEGLHCYDLRGSDDDPGLPVTVENHVVVNHAGTVITAKPLDLGEDGRKYLTEEEGLNFVGGDKSAYRFFNEQRKDRNTEEVEAESISFAVCAYYGIATGENSFGYIATWSKDKELKELRASLETINKTSSELITDIDRNYAEITKEREADLSADKASEITEETTEAPDQDVDQEKLYSIDDKLYLHVQTTEDGFDYTFYDAESKKQLDGGQLDEPDLGLATACEKICEMHDVGKESVKDAPLSMVEELQEAALKAMEQEAVQFTEAEKEDKLTFYVAECMEFPSLGEYHENLTLDEAVRLYEAIPAERLNAVKGIGFRLESDGIYDGSEFPILSGNTIDVDSINIVDYFRDSPLVQKAVEDLISALPDKEVEWEGRPVAETIAEDTVPSETSAVEDTFPAIEPPVEEAPPVQAPDNGYMPDPSMSVEAMNAYGYTDSDMLPLSKERALELFERDVPIYMLYEGNTEAMAFEAEDIVLFSGCFGITREDWDSIKDEIPPMDMETVRQKREQAFLDSRSDAYAIYQLKDGDATADIRFMSTDYLQKKGMEPQYGNYELVYTGTLTQEGSDMEKLENLYRIFNIEHPQDFTGHSLSVSDIVALKQSGVVSYHYVDSIGYKELPNFRDGNPLKNAEMQLEDDYGMIDGVINNAPKEPPKESVKPAPKREETKSRKPSVLAKLRKYQEEDRKVSTQHRSAERDL